jgi:hypothetical protein
MFYFIINKTVRRLIQISLHLFTGFLSWDSDVCHVDLEKELLHLAAQKPDGEESKNGERGIFALMH